MYTQDSPYSIESIHQVQPDKDWAVKVHPVAQAAPRPRIFKIGSTRVQEDESTVGQPLSAVTPLLAAMYPEVKHATTRSAVQNGVEVVEFLPQPGRKG